METDDGARTREDAVRRYWREIWSEGRFDLAGEFYAPSYRENLEATTPAEFAAGSAAFAAHFVGLRVDVEELFSAGARVVSRVTYRGRHIVDFKRVPARGRTCAVPGIDIFEFEDGLVVQHWHATDHLDLFRQLGGELTAAQLTDAAAPAPTGPTGPVASTTSTTSTAPTASAEVSS